MKGLDAVVVLILVGLLAGLAGVVAAPAFSPAVTPAASLVPTASRGYVEGVLGRPSSITPLTARTQVDRDLVALLFRGLVRLGPASSIVPDLADTWAVDRKGARWTFRMRTDAAWHDGVPVTSADVVFTVRLLQDPGYSGPLAATWAQVQVAAPDAHTVVFNLGDPAGGFLQAAALPLLPAHILDGLPVDALAEDAFAKQPIGNGPFTLVELGQDSAVLEPVLPEVADAGRPLNDPVPGAPDPRTPQLERLELRFFDSPEQLSAAFAVGTLDAAADLPEVAAMALAASSPGAQAIRYPATTLTAITFNLRTPRGPFSDARTRRALLAAVDRESLVVDVLGGAGVRADTPIPPSSWAFDPEAAPLVAFDRKVAAEGLRDAGWRRENGTWIAPGGSKPFALELLAPAASASRVVNTTAARIAATWSSFGLATDLVELAPGEFVDRLRSGDFAAAVVDVNIGLDPDLYPILASSQAREGGANVSGIQDLALDTGPARGPGTGVRGGPSRGLR